MIVPNPSPPLELGFIALVLIVAAAIVALVRRADGPATRVAIDSPAGTSSRDGPSARSILRARREPNAATMRGPSAAPRSADATARHHHTSGPRATSQRSECDMIARF